ncbi:recombinase family protein [bacterium AH-315-P15]|nr:recombinase family protein [bacterium AH-315-P15]
MSNVFKALSDPTRRRVLELLKERPMSAGELSAQFNSLDAQREACAAYIQSQRHEGWSILLETFDDGGFSGGTMERPGLQALLEKIKSGTIDVVVVYKIDRLTRSLFDFAKIVETFDEHQVSFVSVTQAFNTTTSMGRLTLNVLLSFAQFEREVTGERIRDKIAASKAKGMWMGGNTPLGYKAFERTLHILDEEADAVRTLFALYLETGCARKTLAAAAKQGITSKAGRPIARGALYTLLSNPVYMGKIRHKDQVYPGLHEGIIGLELWERVQAQLERARVKRRHRTNAKNPSLLAGKLFDGTGTPFVPSYCVKEGRRYQYYIEREDEAALMSGARPKQSRIPASEIDDVVRAQITGLLRSPLGLAEAIGMTKPKANQHRALATSAKALLEQLELDGPTPNTLLRELITRVTLDETELIIEIDRQALQSNMMSENSGPLQGTHTITTPIRVRRRGVELRYVMEADAGRPSAPHPNLIKLIIRAQTWWNRIIIGEVTTINELAQGAGVGDRYVRRILNLAFLAPNFKRAILDGKQPVELTAERLSRTDNLPIDWEKQAQVLGFN